MNIDLTKIKKVHFLGIGGIGVSAIARMLLGEGKEVSGQDHERSALVDTLEREGARVYIGQRLETIPPDTDLVIYTRALEVYAKDFLASVRARFPQVFSYPEMLESISRDKYTIAIAGCHGKSTTTCMVAHVLMDVGYDPTVIVGSLISDIDTNFVKGNSKYLVVEADEYRRSFLNLSPKVLLITNVDADHLDYYKDLDDIKSAFRTLAEKVPADGVVIVNMSFPNIPEVVKGIAARVIDADSFEKRRALALPGIHNQMNATIASAAFDYLGIGEKEYETSLSAFFGTARRIEKKGTTSAGAIVYDDYAHHPTEIKASLQALRELYPKNEKRLTVVFQPHLYSRTKALFDDFVASFADADEVIVLPIYFARESPDPEVSSEKFADAVQKKGIKAQACSFSEAEKILRDTNLGSGDVLVTMGAGEAYKVGDALLG